MIAREGYFIIGVAVVVALGIAISGFFMPIGVGWIAFVIAAALLGFTLYFFRDPQRTPPAEAAEGNLLLAPADGKIVVITEVKYEPHYLKGPAKQVSIFLSPLNVHVNRSPADGVVEYERYVAGDYLVAWHEKASEKNERSELGILHPSGTRVLFKQIAGAVARRIVYYPKVGDTLKAGERFGIVKFGSRMDVLVPPHVEIIARVGDRVSAGLTILGTITPPVAGAVRGGARSESVSP
ncbi:MAG TPA: phosphatidylserine decarboxylase family protein [Rhodothermales bacterium]|nr:phosphatidylserine decarboxylase family protein [Rhodothermales bacterium]